MYDGPKKHRTTCGVRAKMLPNIDTNEAIGSLSRELLAQFQFMQLLSWPWHWRIKQIGKGIAATYRLSPLHRKQHHPIVILANPTPILDN